MVRATRSSQTITAKEPSPPPAPPPTRKPSKKRKRPSAENVDDPITDSHMDIDKEIIPVVKEEDEKPLNRDKAAKKPKVKDEELLLSKYKDSGDVPLSDQDAHKLLFVLDTLDTQRLLDRVIPLDHQPSSSKTTQDSASLRSLLRDPSSYPIRFLRAAILQLRPSIPVSRARLSQPDEETIRFCDIALGVLEDVALRQRTIDIHRTDIEADVSSHQSQKEDRKKYALYQQLPSGEYFTSAASLKPDQLASLVKGQASIVGVEPSVSIDPSALPTLGSYSRPPKTHLPYRPPVKRLLQGSFLDYGPFASFAPTFDSEGAEVGQTSLSTILWRKKEALLKRIRKGKLPEASIELVDEDMPAQSETDATLDPVLEMDDELKTAFDQLKLEYGIDDLLGHNALALWRLCQLQHERMKLGAKTPEVEVGSEEWNLAQSILSSLSTLISMRPRIAGNQSAPLVPPAPLLRALHRTLPTAATPGWKGTLARDRDIAAKDNSTIRPGTTPYVNPTPVAPPAAPAPTKVAPTNPANAVAASYRPGMPPAMASSYYSPYYTQYAAAGKGTPAAAAAAAQQYYYGYGGYPMQQGVYSPQPAATPGGIGTPQPSRAIPNLARQGSAMAWGTPVPTGAGGGGGTATPGGQTLPAHLRKTTGVVGTPTGAVATPAYVTGAPGTPGAPYTAYSGWPPQTRA
ncbi:hypothetical protein FRC03_001511 [Tulasnella sp. 419]|nr:hypothetical protein FRC03_001511 [Tulasnella sp. 419]